MILSSSAETFSREENGVGDSSDMTRGLNGTAFHPRNVLFPDRSRYAYVDRFFVCRETLLKVLVKCGRNTCNVEQRLDTIYTGKVTMVELKVVLR